MNIINIVRQMPKWIRMVNGESVFHSPQGVGLIYDRNSIKGYYNDLTLKIDNTTTLDGEGIPYNVTSNGLVIYFATTICQFGLAAYDKYLLTNDSKFKDIFLKCVDWLINRQIDGCYWDVLSSISNKFKPYSAMTQGQGASLLIRAFTETRDTKYYEVAKRAIDRMLMTIEQNGMLRTEDNILLLEEVVTKHTSGVLNGWIFALFGLHDMGVIDDNYKEIEKKIAMSLACNIEKYDNGYWSMYDLAGNISSPFYHDLHIAQLEVLYELYKFENFIIFAEKWQRYKKDGCKKRKAFIKKAIQKLIEENNEVVLVK